MTPYFPRDPSGDTDSTQASTPTQPSVELRAPDKEQPEEASSQLNVLRSLLADLQGRLDPDQGVSDLEHMRGPLVLAQRGLAVLERCGKVST